MKKNKSTAGRIISIAIIISIAVIIAVSILLSKSMTSDDAMTALVVMDFVSITCLIIVLIVSRVCLKRSIRKIKEAVKSELE